MIPIAAACAGKSLVSVIPGLVFISRKYGSSFITIKSIRETPRHPAVWCAFTDISFILFVDSSQEEIVKNIYDYVQKIVRYRPASNDLGAKQTLLYRYGKCSEFSALMVALCRARNIPARIVLGNIAREQNQKHVWVEVYFDKYGWVMFDPTANGSVVNTYVNGKLVQKESRFNANKTFMKYIASGRNEFSPWYISYSIGERRNGNITVGENIQIVKTNK